MSHLLSLQQLQNCNNLITVYLRHSLSKSFKAQLSSQTSLEELKNHVASLLFLEPQFQLLFLKGRELRQGRPFKLTDRSILHVKDRRELIQQLTIHLILHDPQKDNIFRHNFTTTPVQVHQSQRIKDFLNRVAPEDRGKVDLKRSRVIQCGRFLKRERSFGEQKVVDKAEVHIILRGTETAQEKDQHMEMFAKQVLKHSRNNSKEQVLHQPNGNQNDTVDIFEQRYQSDLLPREDSLLSNNPFEQNPHLRHSLEPETQEKTNPEKRSNKNIMYAKSSQGQMRQKVKPKVPTLKLGLKEYRKYDGPLSVRACQCKRKKHGKSHGGQSERSSQESPLPLRIVKPQQKLKKSMTVQT